MRQSKCYREGEDGGCDGQLLVFRAKSPDSQGLVLLCEKHRDMHALNHDGHVVTREYYDRVVVPNLKCVASEEGKPCDTELVDEYFFSDGSIVPSCLVHAAENYAMMSVRYYFDVYEPSLHE